MNNNNKASLGGGSVSLQAADISVWSETGGGVYISYGCIVLMQPSTLPNPLESDLNYLHQSYNFPFDETQQENRWWPKFRSGSKSWMTTHYRI